jgi:hypothetical protein
MRKLNYTLNEDGTIKTYTLVPFDDSKPWIECDLSQILLNHSKVINGQLVNDFDLQAKLQELYGNRT